MNRFEQHLAAQSLKLRRSRLQTLQVNLGRKCNQACRHCHVGAGPWRTEMIDASTAQRVGDWISRYRPEILDLTGGAPELSEFFSYLVEVGRKAQSRIIDRSNLTIIEEPNYAHLPHFLAAHQVEVIASLPCYKRENVNRQRGDGVFERSISALRKLNAVGYGTRLSLQLVYNPLGPSLPAPQEELEAEYKEALLFDFGIVFNRLLTITNQPIARFKEDLNKQGQLEPYLDLLARHFNPLTVDGLMCRSTLSVGYRGQIYDCDFNQMLNMQMSNGRPLFLWDIQPEELESASILTGSHCLACTAGCGSSCSGAIA